MPLQLLVKVGWSWHWSSGCSLVKVSVEDGWADEGWVGVGWVEAGCVEGGCVEEDWVDRGWVEDGWVEEGGVEEDLVEDGWVEVVEVVVVEGFSKSINDFAPPRVSSDPPSDSCTVIAMAPPTTSRKAKETARLYFCKKYQQRFLNWKGKSYSKS